MEQEYLDGQKRIDTMMEIERLKDLKVQQQRKQIRQEATLKGGQVLVQQIMERELERQRYKEMLEREKEQMKLQI